MAEERPIVIRFIGEDKVTAVANKVTNSVDKVGNTAKSSSFNLSEFSGSMDSVLDAAGGLMGARGLSGVVGSLGGIAGAAGAAGGSMVGLGGAVAAIANPIGLGVAALVGLGAVLFSVAEPAAKASNEFNALRRSIIRLGDTEADGEKTYKMMEDFAKRTPFSTRDVVGFSRDLLNANYTAGEALPILEAVGDAIYSTGGNTQNMESVITAISRIGMEGNLSYGYLQQLQENGIPAIRILAEEMGVSTAEVKKFAEEGLLPADKYMRVLVEGMQGEYGGAMAEQMNTATQASSNFDDALNRVNITFGTFWEPFVIGVYNVGASLLTSLDNTWKWSEETNRAFAEVTTEAIQNEIYVMRGVWDDLSPSIDTAWQWTKIFVRESQTVANVKGAIEGLKGAWRFIVDEGIAPAWRWTLKVIESFGIYVRDVVEKTPVLKTAWQQISQAISGAVNWTGEAIYNFDAWVIESLTGIKQVRDGYIQLGKAAAAAGLLYEATTRKVYLGNGVWIDQVDRKVSSIFDEKSATENLVPVVEDYTSAVGGANRADSERERALREQERALAEVTRRTEDYNSTIKDLRGSYMSIADAQRSLESAQQALADAQDPMRIQQMTLALQSQQMSLRDLNASMSDMSARRQEIAKALANMNHEQIRNNALTQKERDQMKNLTKDMDNLKKRRDAIRKALAGNNLTQEQRLEYLQTEDALNKAINDKQGQKQTLVDKQNEAIKKSEEERLKLIEEDKKLRDDLEKSQLRYKQAVLSIAQAQRDLSQAQDPKRLEVYRDAVTKAQLNLESLRAQQEANRIKADELATSLGITSGSAEALAYSASLTATPLDDIAIKSGEVNTAIGGMNGTNAVVTNLSGNMSELGDDSADAVSGLTNVQKALKSIQDLKLSDSLGKTLSLIGEGIASIADSNVKFTTDNLSAPLKAVRDVSQVLDSAKATAFTNWSKAYASAVNASSDVNRVRALINSLVSLQNATTGSNNPLPYDLNNPVKGFQSGRQGALGMPSGGTTVQNITINLNYASPPNSKTPLKDVEDYLAAQGGRLRI